MLKRSCSTTPVTAKWIRHSTGVFAGLPEGNNSMTHSMKLDSEPFELIRSGVKTIELRLFDEKRRLLSVGDTIEFHRTDDPADVISARVTALHRFADFEELYRTLPLLRCGYTAENAAAASPDDMERYYSKQQQAIWGVVGIDIDIII